MYYTFADTFAYVLLLRIISIKKPRTTLFSPIRIYQFQFTQNHKSISLNLDFFAVSGW